MAACLQNVSRVRHVTRSYVAIDAQCALRRRCAHRESRAAVLTRMFDILLKSCVLIILSHAKRHLYCVISCIAFDL